MKRFIVSAVIAFSGFLLLSCNFEIVDVNKDHFKSDSSSKTPVALETLLASAESGSTVNLTSNVIVTEDSEITIDKKLTLKASKSFDMKNSSINIAVPSVELKNLKNVNTVTIEDGVGDGDFTLTDCEIETLTVNGGGDHSGHLSSCRVAKLNAAYDSVRLVLEKGSYILCVEVYYSCYICVPVLTVSYVYVRNVRVHDSAASLRLGGRLSIDNLITHSSGGNKPVVLTESDEIEISKAGDYGAGGTLGPAHIESANDEEPVPFYEEFTSGEFESIEEFINDVSFDDFETIESQQEINIDKSGSLTLMNSGYGILVKALPPENVSQINIFRSEHLKNEYYMIGFYRTESKRKLISAMSFTDYYVEEGKAYDYYVDYRTSLNNHSAGISETDSLTATGGRGLLHFNDTLTVSFDPSTFTFSMSGDDSIETPENLYQRNLGFYLKKAGEEAHTSTVESTNYSYISFTRTNYMTAGENPVIDAVNSQTVGFVSSDLIGQELELYKAKVNMTVLKNDIRATWTSLPTDCQGGAGFTDNKITFNEEILPALISDCPEGVKWEFHLDRQSNSGISQVNFKTERDFDLCSQTVKTATASQELQLTSFEGIEKNLTPGKKCRFTINFNAWTPLQNTTRTLLAISIYHSPANGSGDVRLASGVKSTFDSFTNDISINAGEDSILTGGYILPETLNYSINGADAEFTKSNATQVNYQFSDTEYLNKKTVSFSILNGVYFTNMLYRLGAYVEKPLYPLKTQVYANYSFTDLSDNNFIVQKVVTEDALNYIPGVPEPLRIHDNFSGKTFAVNGADGLESITFDEGAAGASSVGFNYDYRLSQEEISYLEETGQYVPENGIEERTGTLYLNKGKISLNGYSYSYTASGGGLTLYSN